MKLSNNFSLEEMLKSSTATKYKINNTPNETLLNYIKELVTTVLLPIRDAFGESVIISSGFRCSALNKKVGGASNSDHMYGCAADIHTKSDTVADNKRLWNVIIQLKDKGIIKCRLIIDEYNYNWIHVSINNKFNSKKNNLVLHIKK